MNTILQALLPLFLAVTSGATPAGNDPCCWCCPPECCAQGCVEPCCEPCCEVECCEVECCGPAGCEVCLPAGCGGTR